MELCAISRAKNKRFLVKSFFRGLRDMGKYPNKAHIWRFRRFLSVGGIVDRYTILDENTGISAASVGGRCAEVGSGGSGGRFGK